MRRAITLTAGATFVLLLAACGSSAGTAPDTTPSPPKRYENARLGFTLEYPEGWVVQEDPSTGTVVQLYAADSAADGFAENLNLLTGELGADVTPAEYLDVAWAQVKPQLTQVEELARQQDLTVGGLPAASIEYLAHYPEVPGQLHFLQVAIVDGQTLFLFTYAGKGDAFGRYRPEAERIIDSFQRT